MKKLCLAGQRGQGKYTLVDDDDFDKVSPYKWYYDTYGYACRTLSKEEKTKFGVRQIALHRFILKPEKGMFTDHINGNRLDNRRLNLRICSPYHNSLNRIKSAGYTTMYKGVSYRNDKKKYLAVIGFCKKRIFLGYFEGAEEAAKAYDEAALIYHKEFARLNFP